MTINDFINKLDATITDSNLLVNFGGLCVLEEKDNIKVAISKKETCKGNLYGLNDTVKSEGFIILGKNANVRYQSRLISQIEYKVTLELFVVPEKYLYNCGFFYQAYEIAKLLKSKGINPNEINNSHDGRREHSTFVFKVNQYIGCETVTFETPKIC